MGRLAADARRIVEAGGQPVIGARATRTWPVVVLGLTSTALAIGLGLAAQTTDTRDTQIVLRDAWVRESTATRTVSAGYVTIDNRTPRDVTLVSVSVAGAPRAVLHTMTHEQGHSSMRSVKAVRIPARSSVELAPGGTHVMLFDVDPPFAQAATVMMTLTFDDHASRSIRAVVRPQSATSIR
jgi:periplasmic copper chaperone A